MDALARAKEMTPEEVAALILKAAKTEKLEKRVYLLEYHLRYLLNCTHGASSEKRALLNDESSDQILLELDVLELPEEPPEKTVTVAAHEKKLRRKPTPVGDETSRGLKFDERTLHIEIEVEDPQLDGLGEEDLALISENRHDTIISLPTHAVVTYICRTTKNKLTGKLSTPKVPDKVFDRCYADVSFLAGLCVDKYAHHLPAYRQHQRLNSCGITLGRKNLTSYIHRVAEVLELIWDAQNSSILQSEVLSADETPTPAGQRNGKMKNGFYWAFHGDRNEVSFLYSPNRSQQFLMNFTEGFEGTLLSDGYAAYEKFAEKTGGVLWAGCWAHARRKFIEAEGQEPAKAAKIIALFQKLYEIEKRARGKPKQRKKLREKESFPIVNTLFKFLIEEYKTTIALDKSPYMKALKYALEREAGLRIFLENPEVPIDNNHTERAIRPTAIGRKNWMFHFTEDGARKGAILYSLIWTCKLQGVDPRVYLIDVLQRIQTWPAAEVDQLTPRLWKENFGDSPMTSVVSRLTMEKS